jgi:hypothetical protein
MRMTSIPPCLVLVTVTALTLTACHSSSPTAGSPATQTTAAASGGAAGSDSTAPTTAAASDGTAGSGSTSSSTDASAPAIVVCTELPASQAASLSGVALATSREQDDAESDASRCDYFPASGTGGFSVSVTAVRGAQAYANSLQTDTLAGAAEHVAPLTGVGDKAFSAQDGVRAVFGDRMIYVAGVASDQTAVTIIKALQAKLG